MARASSGTKGKALSGAASRRPLLYACFFASGAAGLILEIVWSKYLSFLLGNSIYGVSTVVAAFLGGLGIGAALGGRLAARTTEPLLAYARLELIVAVLGLLSPLAYLAARPIFASLNALFLGHGAAFLLLRFLVLSPRSSCRPSRWARACRSLYPTSRAATRRARRPRWPGSTP